jgi:hypothetical protein
MIRLFTYIIFIALISGLKINGQSGQISIDRVTLMPDEPTPYNMRDWKQVAINYDRFVYDLELSGQFLPLISIEASGNNYPERATFGLHTYVGTNNPEGKEAINILPSLVGATLVDIDKSNQNGNNWILMAQDFFNKKNNQNLYLNGTSSKSGNDWWYDMMPNIYFYQLYELYPNMGGEANEQFSLVSENMIAAVKSMGGAANPWEVPYMNYRAWKFETMEPLAAGVPEPEAAGAFSWLLYHAYKETGNEEYRLGAEWAMEFLSGLDGNPSYELQLPYGTYVAAKMNAELGTNYDIEKMVNWSFDRGNLRGWGTIVDSWSGIDASGLVGESESSTDYAFQLNGVQQAAALVPMVRYDKRFARDISKWLLNLANANRLFYKGFLPSTLQDGSEWLDANDPNAVIGHESIREIYNGLSPFATGDAVNGGWAATNLALYGTSSIGYLGGLIEKTNVDKVLKIDLLKTDFFRQAAYPTYLYFNPFSTSIEVDFNTGSVTSDIYDPLKEAFIMEGVSGAVSLVIDPKSAVMPVICPAAGVISYDKNRMLVNDVIVDFDQHVNAYINGPRIKALAPETKTVMIGEMVKIFSTVEYEGDLENLTYKWSLDEIGISDSGSEIEILSEEIGEVEIRLIISDQEGNVDTAFTSIDLVPEIIAAPEIIAIEKSSDYGSLGSSVTLKCVASNTNGGVLEYNWEVSSGSIVIDEAEAVWQLPTESGIYSFSVTVTNESELTASKSESFLVKDFSGQVGELIAYYPLDGNGNDQSGNELNGDIIGAVSTSGINGENNTAYYFNGESHYMIVDSDPLLNFSNGITLSAWIQPFSLPARESFIVSHGSWQNRWKASIIPEQKVRWTINSQNGIRDIDSQTILKVDSFYHITATYDQEFLILYINGEIESYTALSGDIRKTDLPFFLAQSLPDQQDYNFNGVLDEVRIYDFAVTPEGAKSLFETGVLSSINYTALAGNIAVNPNPVSDHLIVEIRNEIKVDLVRIVNQMGQELNQININSNHVTIPFYHYSPGVYFLSFSNDEKQVAMKKIIKN